MQKVLYAKYKVGIVANSDLSNFDRLSLASLWWKDLCGVGNGGRGRGLVQGYDAEKMGNGGSTYSFLAW